MTTYLGLIIASGILTVIFITVLVVLQFRFRSRVQDLRRRSNDWVDFMYHAPVSIRWMDADGTILWANAAELALFGYEESEYVGRNVSEFYLDPSKARDIISRLERDETIEDYETGYRCKDGSVKYVSISSNVLWDKGEFVHIRSFTRDITERAQVQQRLEEMRDQLELEKGKLEEVLSIDDGLNSIVHMHRLVDFIVQKTAKLLSAKRCSLMLVDHDNSELVIKASQGLNEDNIGHGRFFIGEGVAGRVAEDGFPVLVTDIETDTRFCRPKGPHYETKSFMSVPIKIADQVLGVINVADRETSDRKSFNETDLKLLCMIVRQVAVALENAKMFRELNYLTTVDPLTHIHNYRSFTKALDQEIKRLRRYGGALCLMMIDVDHFKSFNLEFGRLQGDIILKKIAAILKENVREVDLVCRYSGEEFAVILPHAQIDHAETVAQRIQRKMTEISLPQAVTISIGVAKYSKNMDRYDLILKADTALYKAKHLGASRVFTHG